MCHNTPEQILTGEPKRKNFTKINSFTLSEPLATKLALRRSILPLEFRLVLYIHLIGLNYPEDK